MRIVVLPPAGVRFPGESEWTSLLDGLRDAGHEVGSYGEILSGASALVTLNDQAQARRVQSDLGIPPQRSALVVLEPRVTAPNMYARKIRALYKHRFAASPLWARHLDAQPFLWPQSIKAVKDSPESFDFSATLVSGDKRSAIRDSLYGLRREVIASCNAINYPLAVFGPGWDMTVPARARAGGKALAKAILAMEPPDVNEAFGHLRVRPTSWLGVVEDKSAAFGRAPLTVVIENSPDYVSEKLIDAVVAGVAPIYVGPNLGSFGFPESLAVTCSAQSADIVRTLTSLSQERVIQVVEAGRAWLASDAPRLHETGFVLRELGRKIGTAIESRDG